MPDCQSIVKKAAVDHLGAHYGLTWLPETGETYQLRFSIMKDLCEVFLDSSGVSLHKRGLPRCGQRGSAARDHGCRHGESGSLSRPRFLLGPVLRLRHHRYRGGAGRAEPRAGPCLQICGAELVLHSGGCLDAGPRGARAAEFRGEYRILGTDIDSGSLAIAIANAKKAGVSKYIEFREADSTRESLPCDHGVIVCNPPYGERMLEQRSAQQLMRQFGRHLRFADGWKKYIISSEPEFEHYFGKQATKSASSTTAACSAMSICISERGADACGMYF